MSGATGEIGNKDTQATLNELDIFKQRVEKVRVDDLRNLQHLIEARKNRRYDDELLRCLMIGLTLSTFLLKILTNHSYNNYLTNLERLKLRVMKDEPTAIDEFEKTVKKFEEKVKYKNSPSLASFVGEKLYSLAYSASNSLPDLGLDRGSADPFYRFMSKNSK